MATIRSRVWLFLLTVLPMQSLAQTCSGNLLTDPIGNFEEMPPTDFANDWDPANNAALCFYHGSYCHTAILTSSSNSADTTTSSIDNTFDTSACGASMANPQKIYITFDILASNSAVFNSLYVSGEGYYFTTASFAAANQTACPGGWTRYSFSTTLTDTIGSIFFGIASGGGNGYILIDHVYYGPTPLPAANTCEKFRCL